MDNVFDRRYVLKLIGGGALASVPGLALFNEARAGITWCRTDPVFELKTPDERKANLGAIYLSAALEDYELNNSSCDIVIEHPKDAKTNLVWVDPTYFGQGCSTNFAIGSGLKFNSKSMDIRVRAYVPASRNDMNVRVEFAPGPIAFSGGDPLPSRVTASKHGYGNQWISFTTRLPYA